ncbi:MAG: alkaline phosphatase family protein [Acidobacteriaceae bacterium]
MLLPLPRRYFLLKKVNAALAAFLLAFLLNCGGTSGGSGASDPGNSDPPAPIGGNGSLNQINHVIWIMQEFRSFDNYFGKLNDYRQAKGLPADVDGLPLDATNPSVDGTAQIPAYHLNTVCMEQMTPAWDASRRDVSRYSPDLKTGPMDGFVYSAARFALDENAAGRGPYSDIEGMRAMGYYTDREIPYYYFMATQFATSDRFFGTILSRTPPNRIANLAASALGVVNSIPEGTTFQQNTILHLLQNAGVSWKIYETEGTYLGYFQPFFGTYHDHVVPFDQFFTDLQNNTLPQVAYIEPMNGANEHTASNIQLGVARVAGMINALMASQSWKDSVFFVTYDHGGEYDHVPPQPAVIPDSIPPQLAPGNAVDDYSRTGFRVPLIVVSPFAKKGYVSHTVMDNTAILKFIETRFNLSNLTERDAAQPDMTEFFELTNIPNATSPSPPTQPTDAPCTYHVLP